MYVFNLQQKKGAQGNVQVLIREMSQFFITFYQYSSYYLINKTID